MKFIKFIEFNKNHLPNSPIHQLPNSPIYQSTDSLIHQLTNSPITNECKNF